MGGGREGGDEDWVNSAGVGDYLQLNYAVSVVIWEQELAGDGFHAKSTRGIPASDCHKDCRNEGAAYDNWRLGVTLGG